MRNTKQLPVLTAALAMAWLACGPVAFGTTNVVPWADSFETYTNGFQVAGTNGWSSDNVGDGIVTTNPAVVGLLTNYAVNGRSYPLPASVGHTQVLQTTNEVRTDVRSVTGGVVAVDVMVMPVALTNTPGGDPDQQYAVYVATNGHVVVWHRNMTGGAPGVNEWLELSNAPVSTGVWSRFTIKNDYAHNLYQVSVNEEVPLTNAAGWAWSAGSLTNSGSWFYMVQTNGALARLRLGEEGTNYVDDVVVTNRSVAWTGGAFTESVTNNGTIDAGTTLVGTLLWDTWAGTTGEDLTVSGKASVTGLPAGLTGMVLVASTTQVTVRLTGAAAQHEYVNSVSNGISVTFSNSAFALGNAWDVTGLPYTSVSVTFSNGPQLSWTGSGFTEAAANDGSFDPTNTVTIGLVYGTFNGATNEDFGTNGLKVAFTNMPSGLTGAVTMVSSTQLQMRLTGSAAAHAAANSTNLLMTFQDGAFNTVPASSVLNNQTNLSITFADPGVLTYGATVFHETVTNNGTVSGTTLTLSNKYFNATNGEDLVASGKVTISPSLGGLGVQIIRGATAQDATLIFTGTATSNAFANSITNLVITFDNSAFVGENAGAVSNWTLPTLQIQFNDPRILTYSGISFREISGGVIDNHNPVTITLSGDTLNGTNGEDFVSAGLITLGGPPVPPGLTAQITQDTLTQLSVRFLGIAVSNEPSDSVSNIVFAFQDGAFVAGNAIYVSNSVMSGISITFTNDTGFFNVMPYAEPFEQYPSGTLMAGTNGWSADYPDAGVVTNDPAATASLALYLQQHAGYPVAGAHQQVLDVLDGIRTEIHTEGAHLAYLDFMTVPLPMQFVPDNDTNRQYALYVSTNQQLVIWHCNTAGGAPTNEWRTLPNGGSISTSQWVRITVAQDYALHRFQVRINEGLPVTDPAGWSDSGLNTNGSWFNMVQTNASLTRVRFAGLGMVMLDDVTVRAALSDTYGQGMGSIFKFR